VGQQPGGKKSRQCLQKQATGQIWPVGRRLLTLVQKIQLFKTFDSYNTLFKIFQLTPVFFLTPQSAEKA